MINSKEFDLSPIARAFESCIHVQCISLCELAEFILSIMPGYDNSIHGLISALIAHIGSIVISADRSKAVRCISVTCNASMWFNAALAVPHFIFCRRRQKVMLRDCGLSREMNLFVDLKNNNRF